MDVLLSAGLRESSISTDEITGINWTAKGTLGIYFHHLYENPFENIKNIIFPIIVKNSFA
jgi:hypothetical protein